MNNPFSRDGYSKKKYIYIYIFIYCIYLCGGDSDVDT